jgi:hypothetical protein
MIFYEFIDLNVALLGVVLIDFVPLFGSSSRPFHLKKIDRVAAVVRDGEE